MSRHRAPLDPSGGRPTTGHELQLACGIVDRSGVAPMLEPHFDTAVGRHRTISLRGLLVACQLNALARHHKAHLIEVARVINALTDEQRQRLGIVDHDPAQTYHRVDRAFTKLADILDAGIVGIIAKWLANQLALAGTDVETWGALHGEVTTVGLDGEASETQLMDVVPKPKKAARKAKVLGQGRDGRNIYTVDPTLAPGIARRPTAARPDRMSATNSTWVSRPATSSGLTT